MGSEAAAEALLASFAEGARLEMKRLVKREPQSDDDDLDGSERSEDEGQDGVGAAAAAAAAAAGSEQLQPKKRGRPKGSLDKQPRRAAKKPSVQTRLASLPDEQVDKAIADLMRPDIEGLIPAYQPGATLPFGRPSIAVLKFIATKMLEGGGQLHWTIKNETICKLAAERGLWEAAYRLSEEHLGTRPPGLLLEVACAHYQRHRNPSKRARNEEAKAVEEEKQGKRDTEVIRIVRKELCRSEDAPAVFPLYLCQIGTVPNASLKWLNVYELPRALVREYEASLPAADTSRIKKEEALAALSLAPQDPPEPMVSENPSSSVAASSLPPGHPHYASKVAFRRKQAKQLMLEIGKREEAILNATKDKSSAAAAAAPIPARAVRELAALSVQLVEKFPDVLLPDERTQLEEFAAAVQQMGSDAMAAGLCEGTSSSHPPLPRLACSAGDDSSSSPVAGSSHTGAQGEGSRIEASARGAPSGFPYELYEHFVIAHMKVSTLGAKLPLNDYDALWRLQQVAEEWAHDTIRHARKEGLNVVDVLSERLAAIEAERRRTRANSALPNQSRDDDPGSAGSHHSPPTHTQEQATPRTTPDTTTTTQPPDFVTGALAVEYRRRQSANRTHSGGLTPATFLSSLLQDVQGTQPPAYLLNHATDSGRLAQLHSWLASGAAVDVGAFTRLVVTAGKAVKSAASASAGDGGGGRSALADVVMRQYQGFYYGWLAPEMHRMKMPAHKQKPYADLFLKTRDCLKAMCANPNESPQTVHYYLQQLVFKFGAKLGEYRLRHPPTPTPAPAGAPQAPSLSVSAVPAPPQQPTCNGMPLPAAQPEQQPSVPAFPALFQAPYDNRSGSGLSAAAGQEARGGTEETGGVGHDAGGQVTHCAARDPPAAEEVPDEPSGGQHQEPQQQQPV